MSGIGKKSKAGEVKAGIVILNYNTWKESIQCVESIIINTSGAYHIYMVDNHSTDDSGQKLQDYARGKEYITYIKAEENRGYSAGNNLGIKRAIKEGCGILYIINSDVELLNDALDRMKGTLLNHEDCMVVGPSVLDNERSESQLARKKFTWKIFLFERHPLCYIPYFKKKSVRKYEIPEQGNFIFEGMVAGCCFGIRSEDMERIQYLDENVFLYYEEDILAYKMASLCKKTIVDCEAKIWHKENVSTKKQGSVFVRFCRWSSVFYILKEYAKIEKWKQYFVFISNISVWIVMSFISKKYRKYLKQFIDKNVSIMKKKESNTV